MDSPWSEVPRARDERVAGKEEPKRKIQGLGDAYARSGLDVFRPETIVGDPQTGFGRGEVAAIIASARDAVGLDEASGTGREIE
jgi:hypothetical protein